MTSQSNAVEKDDVLSEALDTSPVEPNGAMKVSPKVPTKVNRLPGYREVKPLSQLDVRRYLGERSRELQSFIAPLEEEIRRAHRYRSREKRRSPVAQAKVADLVLKVVRDIAHRETGIFNLEPHVTQLLSALYAGSVEVGIVGGLVRRAQKILAARDVAERSRGSRRSEDSERSRVTGYDISRELDELTMLLKWYVRRKMSLASLEIEISGNASMLDSDGSVLRDEHDALYGLEVMHDQQVFGTKGCVLACGLRLVGRDGQPLWLRVGVRCHGEPVVVRADWSSWTDPGSGEALEVLEREVPFCSLVPVRPNAQRLIIDEVRAFVPYSALELPVGRCDVEFVISIIDGDGEEILVTTRPESICVPRRDTESFVAPAPHAAGMWPHDVVSGDKISELSVTSGFKMVAGWERHSVSVQFDLSLFMHAGEGVMLECRFVDKKGDIVELSSLGIPFVASELNVAVESVSSYRYRRVLHPKGAWAFYRGLSIDIPVEFLLLEAGAHELTCELVIASSDDRVLAGDMGRVSVLVPDRTERKNGEAAEVEKSPTPAIRGAFATSLDLESIEVDSSWEFGGEESIRVEANFSPHNAGRRIADLAAGRVGELFSPYRVEISLEREDGHVLLQAFSDSLGMSFRPVTRSVCVEGHAGALEHSVVANFSKDEVLGWSVGLEGARIGSKTRLFARVTALTPAGEVLVSQQKEFFVKPVTSGGRRVIEIRDPAPVIVDVGAHAYAQAGNLSVRALVNVPFGEFMDEGLDIHCALVRSDGKRELLSRKVIGSQQSAVWTRQQMGLSQFAVVFEHPSRDLTDGQSPFIEVSIHSANGEELHRVIQVVRSAGVLSDAEISAAESESDSTGSLSTEADFPDLDPVGTTRGAKKGLLTRLLSGFTSEADA